MALTERYVTESGAGAQNGNDLANAFSIGQAINELNTSPSGYRYNLNGAFNLASGITITGNGVIGLPNVICGYNSVPGDGCLGRNSSGYLDDTNMATINFTSATYRFQAQSANYLIIQGIKVSGSYGGEFFRSPNVGITDNCIIISNTNSATNLISTQGPDSNVQNCDIFSNSTNSSTTGFSGPGPLVGSRISVNSGIAIQWSNNTYPCVDNIIYDSRIGLNKITTSARLYFFNNTVANCSQNAVEIVNGTTAGVWIVGNHITGCGGYAVNFNTSACPKYINFNRFRNNASGDFNISAEYIQTMNYAGVTSSGTDADDFVSVSSGNYSLKSTAAGVNSGLGFLKNIGGAGTLASSGVVDGTGTVNNYYFIARR